MNINKYDYYGKYDNKDEYYSTSVFEIQQKQQNREKRRTKIYTKILENCFKRIKLSADKEETVCIYTLPEYMAGVPLYNMTDCVMFILKHIKEKGFNCRYCHPYTILITWNKGGKYIEYKNKENDINKLDLKYKPIDEYKPSGNFLYTKKVNY